MATYTTNYNLVKPESTDYYNHQLYDNSNYDIIDEALHNNKIGGITEATDVFNGTTHTITRNDTSVPFFWFVADYKWQDTYTMIVDESTVSVKTVEGTTLENDAFVTGSRVLALIDDGIMTVFTNAQELDGITGDIETLDTEFNSLNSTVTDLGNTVTELTSSVTADIENLNTEFSSLNSSVEGLESRLTSDEAAIASNTSDISTLNSTVTDLGNSVTNLVSSVATNTSDINNLEASVSDIDSRTTTNTNNIAINTTDIADLTSSINTLSTERNYLTEGTHTIRMPAVGVAPTTVNIALRINTPFDINQSNITPTSIRVRTIYGVAGDVKTANGWNLRGTYDFVSSQYGIYSFSQTNSSTSDTVKISYTPSTGELSLAQSPAANFYNGDNIISAGNSNMLAIADIEITYTVSTE